MRWRGCPAIVVLILLACGMSACGPSEEEATGESGKTPVSIPTGPVRTALDCLPSAEVWIDGAPRGTTPTTVALEPGAHEAVFKKEGFLDEAVRFQVEAGVPTSVSAGLVVADPDDDAALSALAMSVGIERESLEGGVARHRGAGKSGITLFWPQGDVRLEALGSFRVDVDVDYEGDGFLEFRKGGRTLHRVAFDPEEIVTVEDLPAEVLAAVKTNSVVTWGVYYEGRRTKPVTCNFKAIRKPKVDRSLAKLERGKNFLRQPEVTREILRADVLRNYKLHCEALIRYLAIAQEWPDSTLPYKGIAASAQRLRLQDTAMYAEAARFSAGRGKRSRGTPGPGGFAASGLPQALKGPSLLEIRGKAEDAPTLTVRLTLISRILEKEARRCEDEVKALESENRDEEADALRDRGDAIQDAADAALRAGSKSTPPRGRELDELLDLLAVAAEAIDARAKLHDDRLEGLAGDSPAAEEIAPRAEQCRRAAEQVRQVVEEAGK